MSEVIKACLDWDSLLQQCFPTFLILLSFKTVPYDVWPQSKSYLHCYFITVLLLLSWIIMQISVFSNGLSQSLWMGPLTPQNGLNQKFGNPYVTQCFALMEHITLHSWQTQKFTKWFLTIRPLVLQWMWLFCYVIPLQTQYRLQAWSQWEVRIREHCAVLDRTKQSSQRMGSLTLG